ncbi:MAG: cyclic pyranopterin monophosphate synthase MoaC [Planctomycetota bacterium]
MTDSQDLPPHAAASDGGAAGSGPSHGETPTGEAELSHVEAGPDGRARAVMVDVGGKEVTGRSALARAFVLFPPGVMGKALGGGGPKGPVVEVARIAGIQAAKRTGELVPMCHPLGLDHVSVECEPRSEDRLEILCRASCSGRTGVEMEAMVGASIAALTVYDMAKALSKGIRIEAVELLEKTGGKSGTWRRTGDAPGS